MADNTTFTLTTDAQGEAISEKLIPGKYRIKEVKAPSGYVLNQTEYEVDILSDRVTVQEMLNDPVKPKVVEVTETFPVLKVPLLVNKVLKNGSLKGGEFTFLLKDAKGSVIAQAQNAADGTVAFPDRTFSKEVSNYLYTIHEVLGTDTQIAYDKTVYTVKVTTKAVNGRLQAAIHVEKDGIPYAGAMTFTNQREMPKTGDTIYRMLGLLLLSAALMSGAYAVSRRQGKAMR